METVHLGQILKSYGDDGWEVISVTPIYNRRLTMAEYDQMHENHPQKTDSGFGMTWDRLYKWTEADHRKSPEPRYFHVVLKRRA